MALEKADRTEISKFVRDTIQRLPPRGMKAVSVGRLIGTPQADTPPTSDSSDRLSTTAWVNKQGFATQSWVTAQGFLTAAPVTSVFTRTGAVVAAAGDYTAAQVTNALDLSNAGTQTLAGTLTAGNLEIGGKALPGTEIAYDQITANVNITGTVVGSATTVIAGSAHTYDGSPVDIEFRSPAIIQPAVAGGTFTVVLFEGGTAIAYIAQFTNPAAAAHWDPVTAKYRFTPSAGSHTYSIKCFVSSTTGTPAVGAGAAGAATGPASLRITKV